MTAQMASESRLGQQTRTLEEAISVYKKIPPERMNGNPQVQEAVKEFIRLFPDKEVIDY